MVKSPGRQHRGTYPFDEAVASAFKSTQKIMSAPERFGCIFEYGPLHLNLLFGETATYDFNCLNGLQDVRERCVPRRFALLLCLRPSRYGLLAAHGHTPNFRLKTIPTRWKKASSSVARQAAPKVSGPCRSRNSAGRAKLRPGARTAAWRLGGLNAADLAPSEPRTLWILEEREHEPAGRPVESKGREPMLHLVVVRCGLVGPLWVLVAPRGAAFVEDDRAPARIPSTTANRVDSHEIPTDRRNARDGR